MHYHPPTPLHPLFFCNPRLLQNSSCLLSNQAFRVRYGLLEAGSQTDTVCPSLLLMGSLCRPDVASDNWKICVWVQQRGEGWGDELDRALGVCTLPYRLECSW